MRAIGYYIHHHGDGHRQRALAIAAENPQHYTLIGTGLAGRTGAISALDIPDDRMIGRVFDGEDGEPDRPQAFHYAPLRHGGVRQRMGMIAAWITAYRPALMVVDVSVEIALFARLCAAPTAYVRLAGRRDDPPHLEAFRAASFLIAPFARALDDPQTPDWIIRKTMYAPGISGRCVAASACPGRVLVVVGRGGSSVRAADIAAAARATPDRTWRVIGMAPSDERAANLTFIPWSDDPYGEIARAEIIIGGAGDGLVNAVIAARRPFICIPERRPFDEQISKALMLNRTGAAWVEETWPTAQEWSRVLDAACALDPAAQAALDDINGAANIAKVLREFADDQK